MKPFQFNITNIIYTGSGFDFVFRQDLNVILCSISVILGLGIGCMSLIKVLQNGSPMCKIHYHLLKRIYLNILTKAARYLIDYNVTLELFRVI